jgi:hypothetical protein
MSRVKLMPTTTPIQKVTDGKFLAELHHLLWIEPFDNQGSRDEGWNCRDHAFIAGLVLQLLKQPCAVLYGEATYVQGPAPEQPAVGLEQKIHAWLGVDGQGFMDLSPRLTRCANPPWRPWRLQYIARDRCVPDGAFEFARTEGEYARRVGQAAERTQARTAIYHGKGVDNIDREFAEKAFQFIDSPLTKRLLEKYADDLYLKAAVHLFKFLRGETRSLQQLSQDEAWEEIARQPGSPLNWITMKGGLQ